MSSMLWAGGALVSAVLAVVLVGRSLPQGHVAKRRARFGKPADEVWAVITDFERLPSWRKELKSVVLLPERDGHAAFKEIGGNGEMELHVVELQAPRRMVLRIAPGLPFGGTWTYELEPRETGSELTLTEAGEVYHPVFRFLSHFVFGHTATLEKYLTQLARKLGDPATPEPG